jgi:zinc transporter, ZIP family
MDTILSVLAGLSPIAQAALAGTATWAITALGAAVVFLRRELPERILDAMLGFAAGVMIAASFWSLLNPAVDTAAALGMSPWLTASLGFLLGAGSLGVADRLLPHLHPHLPPGAAEGVPSSWRRATLLVTAITLHNIPEGLAVGVAFAAASADLGVPVQISLSGAVALAIGIGLQNFPEGIAVAMPLRREGVSRFKCFWYGQLSAAVEPVAAVVGAAAVLWVLPILPYALSFAAGAMLYVVLEELIPAAQSGGRTDLATSAAMVGFTIMMILDVALG